MCVWHVFIKLLTYLTLNALKTSQMSLLQTITNQLKQGTHNGRSPCSLGLSTLQPASMKTSITGTLPANAAQCNAVLPSYRTTVTAMIIYWHHQRLTTGDHWIQRITFPPPRLSAKFHYTETCYRQLYNTTNGWAHNNSTTCCTTDSPPTDKNLVHPNLGSGIAMWQICCTTSCRIVVSLSIGGVVQHVRSRCLCSGVWH